MAKYIEMSITTNCSDETIRTLFVKVRVSKVSWQGVGYETTSVVKDIWFL
jgi:hypothetical protein